jgi:hypothetical protein
VSVRGQQRDYVAPEVPVLRPSMEQHDRLALAGFRHMHPQVAGIDEAMPYAPDLGERAVGRHARGAAAEPPR